MYNRHCTDRLAQLVRASRLHRGGRGFKSLSGHMIENFFRNSVFNNFLKIELNPVEVAIANESLISKYTRGLKSSLIAGVLIIPTLLFVDTSVLSSVLIPITMVSGTAWFAVSLVNIKRKFEPFGNELTVDLYTAFMTSLVFLALMSLILICFVAVSETVKLMYFRKKVKN